MMALAIALTACRTGPGTTDPTVLADALVASTTVTTRPVVATTEGPTVTDPPATEVPTTLTPPECPPPGRTTTVRGDLDGDGSDDVAYYDVTELRLVACTGRGTVVAVAAPGLGEVLRIADLQMDGRDEILVGSSTAWGIGVAIAVIADGNLELVTTTEGRPLDLVMGLPPDRFLEYGCIDTNGDGRREVAVIEGEVSPTGTVAWQRLVYTITGARAVVESREMGTFSIGSVADVLSTPEVIDLRGGEC